MCITISLGLFSAIERHFRDLVSMTNMIEIIYSKDLETVSCELEHLVAGNITEPILGLLASRSFIHNLHYSLAVSYTHLTLPTNREV